jgi:ubiquinone/menaquinone biosynthesis C-methylase UbiE
MKPGDYQTKAQAKDYHQHRFKGGLTRVDQEERRIISQWLRKVVKPDQSLTADLGAGTGRIVGEIIKYRPKKIFAVDTSPSMLGQLKSNYQQEINNGLVEMVAASADKVPLKKNNLKLVTALHLFKHLKKIEPTINGVAALLKPKGYFIFDALNPISLVRFNLKDCRAQSLSSLKEALEKADLMIKEIIYLQVFGETVYRFSGVRLSSILAILDRLVTKTSGRLGTKMLILAQKR